uniref:Immunoglobulin superfamily member 22 n=1 Tax=Callorhinchus milii TaxID=7868 RepID=A0A4W3GQK8_CALMI
DAYKCIASNVHADCTYTVSLSVTESESAPAPREERKVPDEKEMWEILVKADKKDYERICIEYGFTDFRGMLKRLKEMKKKVDTEVSHPPVWLLSLQGAEPIRTQFSLGKYELKQVGTKYQLVVKNVSMKDSGMYSLQVADKRMSAVLNVVGLSLTSRNRVTVTERQTGVFECKLTKRVDGVLWRWNGAELKRDEKHDITVSEDGLTHTLKVKDVRPSDLGLYSVCVGDKTSSGQMLIDSTSLNPSLTPSLPCPHPESAPPLPPVCPSLTPILPLPHPHSLTDKDGVQVVKQGAVHKLVFSNVGEKHEGKYTFRAKGAESEAILSIADPPVIDADLLALLAKEPITVKAGQTATIKIPFHGKPVPKISWFRDGLEVCEDEKTELEKSPTQAVLVLKACVREDSGNILLKLKSDCGTAVANLHLNVIDKPKPPHGSLEFLEHTGQCVSMKWKAPRDNGGKQVTSFVVERKLVGKKSWVKVGEVDSKTTSFSTNKVEEGTAYQFRVRAVNSEGISDPLVSDEVFAGDPIVAGNARAPQLVDARKDAITITWAPPGLDGGAPILGYIVERRKKGSNVWVPASKEPIQVEDMEYEFRVTAVNRAGPGIPSSASIPVMAKDPIRAPGLVKNINVTDSTNSSVSLAWEKPEQGDEPQGYILEMRAGESKEWTKCSKIPITSTSYTVGGLQERNKYFFRIRAVNEGGVGEPKELDRGVYAMPPPGNPTVFPNNPALVSRVGDGVFRVGDGLSLSLVQGSPPPTVMWLKDGTPAKGKETITKGPKMSQFLVPSAQRSDSALYRILLRNEYGEKYHDLRVRVADFPRPPTNLRLVEDVPNTVTLSWDHTPDNMEDGRAHYVIMKRDASTATWFTVAERVHGNKYTVTGLLPGRKYYFRVIARNDIGDSEPLDSREPWYVARDKERFDLNLKKYEEKDRSSAPKFITPLRNHNAQRGRDCTMSCAVSGNPRPHITWYKGKVNLSDKLKYWHTSSTGVCTLTVPSATTKDTDDYTIVAENTLGKVTSTCRLTVYNPPLPSTQSDTHPPAQSDAPPQLRVMALPLPSLE